MHHELGISVRRVERGMVVGPRRGAGRKETKKSRNRNDPVPNQIAVLGGLFFFCLTFFISLSMPEIKRRWRQIRAPSPLTRSTPFRGSFHGRGNRFCRLSFSLSRLEISYEDGIECGVFFLFLSMGPSLSGRVHPCD